LYQAGAKKSCLFLTAVAQTAGNSIIPDLDSWLISLATGDSMPAAETITTTTFGDLLKFLRKRARLTQRELGIAVGYAETQITRLEGNTRLPDPVVVRARFIDALGLEDEPQWAQQLVALAIAAQPANETRRTNLPAHLSRFMGRRHELDEIAGLVGTHRVVTLTGSGGVGKTRLALEAGAGLIDAFADGVWLVELAALSDATMVAGTLASALGLRPTSRPAQSVLIDYLHSKHLLLIIDNCEHLVHACAELVEEMARACPRLRILCTSREPLRVAGEMTWRVPSLPAQEASLLFEQRAGLTKFGFVLNAANTPLVAQICERLDGMPLAIELAAARLGALSLHDIAVRLDDRFRLLNNGARTALPRQQTLHTLIDWSYNLLSDEECALFRQLSVFAGGWTLASAEAIFDHPQTLHLHAQLVAKSLIVMDDSVESDAGERYHLLETLRQYAHEKLVDAGEWADARQRHLEHCIHLAQTAKPHLHHTEQVQWLDRLDAEIDNLRTALAWVRQSGDLAAGEALVDGIWLFWFLRGHLSEGIKWVSDLFLSDTVVSDALWVKAHAWMGWMALHKGAVFDGRRWFTAAGERVHALGDPHLLHQVYWGLGLVSADFEAGCRLLNEAIAIAHDAGWMWEETQARWALGAYMRKQGDPQVAQETLLRGLLLARQLGDRFFISQLLLKLGLRAVDRGDFRTARPMFEESVAQVRELGDPVGVADAIIELCTCGLLQGDWDLARAALKESIAAYGKVGNNERLAQCVSIAAGIAHAHGEHERAACLLGAVAAARAGTQRRFEFISRLYDDYDRLLPLLKEALDPMAFERAWEVGRRMSLSQALEESQFI
jgi:predicted ATPase/transcriptional regulator with XRE-family HTH domain